MGDPKKAMTEAKKKTDWERVEADYRAGLLSVREIGAAHGVSHTAINKRAKTHGWVRDLSKRIQAKAEELVSKQTVSKEVSTETLETDRQIVEANAKVIADIRLTHRRDIAKARSLAMRLLGELEIQTGDLDLFEQLAELLNEDGEGGQDRRQELFARVLSLPSRVDGMKKLAETLKNLVGLEREAYGLASGDADPTEDAPSGLDHFYGGH